MNNKSQGMSIRVIVVAVLCVLVLMVLVFIYSGGMKRLTGSMGSAITCESRCEEIGFNSHIATSEYFCNNLWQGSRVLPGTYSDVSGVVEHSEETVPKVCCCLP